MGPFTAFQRRILFNYMIGSLLAVFGVGSVFIFHTLSLSDSEVHYLVKVMVISVVIMLTGEFIIYRSHVKPIKEVFRSERPSMHVVKQGYLAAHQFPLLTVKRIMGPHLFGLAIPSSLLSLAGIYLDWIHLPYYYVALAWSGAFLIAVLHSLIEFFLTYQSVQLLLHSFSARTKELGYPALKLEGRIYLSIKRKMLISSLFTAVFPVLLFILASQIRLSQEDGSGLESYWSWSVLVIVVILFMALVVAVLLYRSIEQPMNSLRQRFEEVRSGELEYMDNIYSDEFSKLVTGFNHMVSSIKERDERNEQLLESFFTVFAATLDARDPYTAGHSARVADYCVQIASRANFSLEDIDLLRKSALLHDIGKIGVRDHVLLKEKSLTEEEFEQIKQHPVIGADILHQVQLPSELLPVIPGVRSHHERLDGKGYPDGLTGPEIPLFGRLMAVADAFDAMTSDRPYRKGMSIEQAMRIIEEGKGTQWDVYFADLLLDIMRENNVKPVSISHEQ